MLARPLDEAAEAAGHTREAMGERAADPRRRVTPALRRHTTPVERVIAELKGLGIRMGSVNAEQDVRGAPRRIEVFRRAGGQPEPLCAAGEAPALVADANLGGGRAARTRRSPTGRALRQPARPP